MDIKAEIKKVAEKVTSDKTLLEKFKKDPIKTVEGVLGIDLPDEMMEKVVDGVKVAIAGDKVSGAVDAFKKLF